MLCCLRLTLVKHTLLLSGGESQRSLGFVQARGQRRRHVREALHRHHGGVPAQGPVQGAHRLRHRHPQRRRGGTRRAPEETYPALVLGLDTDIKPLSSHLVTLERIRFSHRFVTDGVCPRRAPL
eukprot:3750986-Pyramimonas_sp.AAC.1